jgi:hypothetical protein
MFWDSKRTEYLKKAKEAEALAAKAKDPATREAWQRIAVSYLELAKRVAPKS